MIKSAVVCPHPPIIVPDVGGKNISLVKKTVAGMKECAHEIKKYQPETFVVISPHGPMRYDKFTVNLEENFWGSFSNFGGSSLEYKFKNDTRLAWSIVNGTKKKHFPVEVIRESELDHGTLVPLHYLSEPYEQEKPRIVLLTYTALDWKMHFEFGKEVGAILDESPGSCVLVASGDLSHRLTEDAPAGFSPYGIKFDHTLIDLLSKNDVSKIMNLNPDFCEEAGECGLRSVIIALGILSETKKSFKQISYEGPFGVGYLVGQWKIG